MSAKHTPGPWEAFKGVEEGDDLRCGVSAMRGDLGYLIATIENGAPGDFCDTEFANARLIAAAPDLLEALVKAQKIACSAMCNQHAGQSWPHDPLCEEFHAAIAKATQP